MTAPTPTVEQLEYAADCFLRSLQARDLETGDHATRVSEIALTLGRALNFTAEELQSLAFGAKLHDVGKIKVPDAILKKPGPLTAEEWIVMREHPRTGGAMLRDVNFPIRIVEIVEQRSRTLTTPSRAIVATEPPPAIKPQLKRSSTSPAGNSIRKWSTSL